jgi:hypothetical protein
MLVPLLDLRTLDGAPAPWKDLWQKKNLLLLIAHEDCEECPRVLERWLPHLQQEEAAAVAIYASPPDRPIEGVISLLDPEGKMAKALGVPSGTAVAADRYFSVQAREPVHELGAEAASEDTLAWIDLAERRCDECGVPIW